MYTDTYGQKISETYRIIPDASFERRLKLFDPRLKLMFDQRSKRWMILEKAYDNSGWNCVVKCENKDGTEKPLGEWVFNVLWVKRQNWMEASRMGASRWIDNLKSQLETSKQKEREKASDDHQAMLREDLSQWRKASKNLQNLPVGDATAGYPKVNV